MDDKKRFRACATWDKDAQDLYQHRDLDYDDGYVVEYRGYAVPQEVPPESKPCNVPSVNDRRELNYHKTACEMDDSSDLDDVSLV